MKGIELLKLIIDRRLTEGQLFKMYENGGINFSIVEWNGVDLIFVGTNKSLNFSQIINSFFTKDNKEEKEVQEIQNPTVRDYLLDELIIENANKLKQKIIEELDKMLDSLGLVLSERTPLAYHNFKNINEAKHEFDEIAAFRKIINTDNFLNLSQEDIVKSLSKICKIKGRYSLKAILADGFGIK